MLRKTPATSDVYQIKVTLTETKPPIWRRIQVPGDVSLFQLHRVLQVAMGWTESHLHQFKIDGRSYGEPDPDFAEPPMINEKRVKLNQVVSCEKARFVYEYDFGDSWEHELLVEQIAPPEAGKQYPVCLAGKRNCPPEDCGGVWGFADFLEAVQDPDHPEHEELLEWVGGEYDPEAFDREEVNRVLKRFR